MKKAFSSILIMVFVFYCLSTDVFAQDSVDNDVQNFDTSQSNVVSQSYSNASNITLELKGVDILDVLKVLSKKSGLNIVAGKNVRGQVTLFLQNVDVWDALKIILETSDLAYEQKGEIIKVITKADYEALYGRPYADKKVTEFIPLKYAKVQAVVEILNQLKSNIGKVIVEDATNSIIVIDTPSAVTQIKNAIATIDVPMETKVYSLRYALSEDLEGKLSEMITPNVGAIKFDSRTNKLIVTDIASKHEQIRKIVVAFDEKPRQVLIEAKIIEVVLDDEYALGIDWDLVFNRTSKESVSFSSTGLGVSSLPTSKSSLSSFTINSSTDDFNAVISSLENMGKTNTLSNPRITVLNNEEASISVATRQPFVSQTVVQGDSTSTTADNVEFVDVGVTLSVTPTITDSSFILMEVKPEVSTAGDSLVIQGSEGGTLFDRTVVPVVTSQEVETTVIVETGKTIVLGGLIQDSQSATIKKVPVLGDIPLLGAAFRSKVDDFKKTELVLFLTPQIITSIETENVVNRFFDDEGSLKPFNEVGGAEFEFSGSSSDTQSYFHVDEKPFWEKSREDAQKLALEFAEDTVFAEKRSLAQDNLVNSLNVLDNKVKHPRIDKYIAKLQSLVVQAISDSSVGSLVAGRVDVFLVVDRKGFLKKVDVNCQNNKELNLDLLLAVNNFSPFPEIPRKIKDDELSVTFELVF